jgi:hypothetical protein
MKQVLFAAVALLCAPVWRAQAQVSAYVDFTAAKFTNLAGTNYLYGPTFGVSGRVADSKRIVLSLDARGQVLGTSQKYNSIAVGPLVQIRIKGLNPYGEFLVGFARYNDGAGNATTDAEMNFNAGIERAVKGPLSWRIFEYGYKQYYALGGQFNPKSFSTGIVYTIGGR